MRQHDDTLETLQELSALQTEALGALVPLSSPGASDEAFRHFLDLARRLVAGVAALEASAPGTLRIQDYAHPLATQLLIYADRRQWAGDAPDADRLRAEAVAITSQYLDPVATAEIHRSLATQAAAEGRFHDSLIGLDNARRVLLSAGKILACVQAEIDLANMYEWLGDFERSLTVLRDAHARFASDLVDGPRPWRTLRLRWVDSSSASCEETRQRSGKTPSPCVTRPSKCCLPRRAFIATWETTTRQSGSLVRPARSTRA